MRTVELSLQHWILISVLTLDKCMLINCSLVYYSMGYVDPVHS